MKEKTTKETFSREEMATSKIKPLPTYVEPAIPEAPKTNVISSLHDFDREVAMAQMEHRDFVEVDKKLFDYLLRGNKSSYLTVGNPGIKVYLEGTREEIEGQEAMSAEHYRDYAIKNKKPVNT